ncbi:U3 snoRNP protein [Ophidiomyces ophidiicola]|nr:U3 snoRNP protein [Ophidiomyces ophidiicola]KAI1931013.1 U3 snoRNP protein [Ophidiomyces ophidiicola]KAI2148867.1 U3 snoRNP protein [Ophidiomyces ophidiicola]KAI2396170.1 U3 snoRNP protein [Ophidiomyces ophidiicola]
MVAAHSARDKPPRLRKGGTETTKSHRFEPFSQRIAKLKIDPVHRVRRNSFSEENGDELHSHFRTSLEHWMELNLSEVFTEFSQRVGRLCESLPQVLYHQDAIMNLLVEYIGRKEELGMEPLLSLLAQFARDLGSKFEKHFGTAVQLVASVAATHSSVEVIEWSFSCLAWIFKFLSRLLVPDLRQLLRIMSPYLGKQPQKHFVARFAAESVSFLIRKAATIYYKNKIPLERAVAFVFEDLSTTDSKRQTGMYQQGLMNMFADAIKGVKGGIHSCGADILQCLIDATSLNDGLQCILAEAVLSGVLVNLVHHSTADTFSPVLDVVCRCIEASSISVGSISRFRTNTRLIFLCVVTRKGSRVQDWKRVHSVLLMLLKQTENLDYSALSIEQLLGATAVAIQTSPMDELLPYMRQTMETMISSQISQYFLPFCLFFSTLGSERFHSVVLLYFQRFILSFWQDYEAGLCLTLPRIYGLNCINSQPNRLGYVTCPTGWKDVIVRRFSIGEPTNTDVLYLNAYTTLQDAISLSCSPSITPQVLQNLHRLVTSAASPQTVQEADLDLFACGSGFLAYVKLATQANDLDANAWDIIALRGPEFAHVPVFLEATLAYTTASDKPPTFSEEGIEPFASSLLSVLVGPSHELRLLSLKIIHALLCWLNIETDLVLLAIEIENSDLTLQTARELSLQVRRLAGAYKETSKIKWLDRLIPSFCFGLLSKKLASLWDDACEAIKLICSTPTGERLVTELAMSWLLPDSTDLSCNEDSHIDAATDEHNLTSEFECFNVLNVEKSLSSSFNTARNSESLLKNNFKETHSSRARRPAYARSQALRVLTAVPHVAEKKSRQLVPLFLAWASKDDDSHFEPSNMKAESRDRWDLRDKKAMLALFGNFTNPRVLYKSSDVHDTLANLLSNGDPEIQKLAMKAIFTWKFPAVQPYEQNLLNLLDDARFRDELAVFVHVNTEDSIIESEHREDLFFYLLRLLYGKMVTRSGLRGSQGGGQEGRRKAILRTVSQLLENDFGRFVGLAFGPLEHVSVLADLPEPEDAFSQEIIGLKRQLGLLKMIETMYSTLKSKMRPFVDRTMNIILYCLVRSCRQLHKLQQQGNLDPNQNNQISLIRNIRQLGTKCLDLVFSISADVDWTPYLPIMLAETIQPRLSNFAVETAQSVSGLLQLFGTWASHTMSALYLANSDIVPSIVDILGIASARDEVKLFVFEVVLNGLVNAATSTESTPDGDTKIQPEHLTDLIRSRIFIPNVEHMLSRIDSLLRTQSSRRLTMAAVDTLSKLAQFVQSSAEVSKLIGTSIYLLRQPPDRVPPKTKGGILRVLQHFLSMFDPQGNEDLNQQIFETLSSMFDYFKDNPNREVLSSVFVLFSTLNTNLSDVSRLITDLNALSCKKLDEVDFERRLSAFHCINEEKYLSFSSREWRPLLYNLIYHIKDEEELAIRTSASLGLRRFVHSAILKMETEDTGEFSELLDTVLLPSLKDGMKQRAETVRAEIIAVFGYLIEQYPNHPGLCDLVGLLANGDEEASFFNNILHIQQHRRQRALRRLGAEVASGKVSATNISAIFFPLIEHYVFNQAEDENAHNLAAEAISTIGILGGGLEWSQFRAIFRRFKGYLHSKPGMEKSIIRLLGQFTDTLNRACDSSSTQEMSLDCSDVLRSRFSRSLPTRAQIESELRTHFISFLSTFIHHKEESEVSLRLPAAVTAVKLLKLISDEERALLLPPILLDISNILKSKSQDSRDVARKTLADIALILGPSYFGYILKELRSTLTKGYQLHVLSFTVHSILLATTEEFKPGALDQDLPTLASVILDDIFGTVGQEKEAEEYVSKMKEVKARKSYDSIELLAKNASVGHVYSLIQPIQRLLEEKLTSNIVKKVDDLLRRIGAGLLRNPGVECRDFLVFCYQVVKESYRVADAPQADTKQPKDRFIVKMIAFNKSGTGRSTSSYLYKLARFSFDVLRSVLNKYSTLCTAENMGGFLPLIGDSLVQGYEEVKISAIRLLSTIIKLPLEEIDRNSDVYLVEALKLVKEAPNTNTEGAQAAIKLIASILRERQMVKLKDSYLAYLIKRVSSDIEEPDRQGVTFNFIRAVMARKLVVPEMYELVDKVAVMMVTNHTRSARDLARGVYVHFLIEYPQTKNRWAKQLGYLAKNLDYRHKEGRQSVMEAVHLLLSKTAGDLAQTIVGTFFIPIVMVMANDESFECREMAGILLKDIYRRSESEQLQSFTSTLRMWLEQPENLPLTSIGLQAMRIFFEADLAEKESEVQFVVHLLPQLMDTPLENRNSEEWETLYFSLQLFIKLAKLFPSITFSPACELIWSKTRQSLFFPHSWIKSCAANLVGMWLADLAKANITNGYGSLPLIGLSGMALDDTSMLDITRGSIFCLQSPAVTEELATQSVRNLVFLGRCFAQNNFVLPTLGSWGPTNMNNGEGDSASETDDETTVHRGEKKAIQYLFERTTRVLRREPLSTKADGLVAKGACMKLLAALCTHLEVSQILPSLQKILLPLLHLTDPSIPVPQSSDEKFQITHKSLVTSSQEILDLLQKKLGTTVFVTELSRAQEGVKSRRDERRVKRRIDAVADPEKFGREKKRRNERKKDKRKDKGLSFRDQRRGW